MVALFDLASACQPSLASARKGRSVMKALGSDGSDGFARRHWSGADSAVMRCCSQRTEAVPSWAPPICCLCPGVVQPPAVRDVGGPAGVVSRGCLVGDCAPSLLLPCVVESVPECDPVLVRYLISRTLLDRETENKHLEREREKEDVPAQSGAPSSANVVSVTDISWHEARLNWYRAHAHSSVPDPSQFQALVVSASSGALASASMPAALVSQPVQSRFVLGGFQPKMFCRHLVNGVCYRGDTCTFAHTLAELHCEAHHSEISMAVEVEEDCGASSDDFDQRCGQCTRCHVWAGAWHPRAHSCVPLLAARGRLNILGLGAGGLASTSLLMGAMLGFPAAAETLFVSGTGSLFCLAEVRSCSVASAWPRSGRAQWLLLCRGQVVFSAVCLAEFIATSAASPASCGSCTVSSKCGCPAVSSSSVSTCSEVVCFCSFSALLSWFVSRALRSLTQSFVSLRQKCLFHTLCGCCLGSFMRCSHVEKWWLSCMLCLSWLPLCGVLVALCFVHGFACFSGGYHRVSAWFNVLFLASVPGGSGRFSFPRASVCRMLRDRCEPSMASICWLSSALVWAHL